MQRFPQGGAFILGGSGALGRAICTAFARASVPLTFSWNNNEVAAVETLAAVEAAGGRATYTKVDSRDREAVQDALSHAARQWDAIHSVIYAGGAKFQPEFFSQTDETVWENWVQTDMLGAINLATAAIPHLRETHGSFTALSTYQGEMVEIRGGPSAISKAAIDRMVKVIAKEEGRFGVRANSLRCGWIGVESIEHLFASMPELRAQKNRSIPLGRLGKPEEVGETVAFLSSLQAGFITGVNLTADGGESL